MCRTKIRKIHYKKKLLEPEYLKFFDEVIPMSSDSDHDSSQPVEIDRPASIPPQQAPRNVVFMVPVYTSLFNLPYVLPFYLPSLPAYNH